jgi:multiple sugar transport system substrate-binding protein
MGKEEKINRRDYLKYTGAAIGGLVVGGALGYVLKPSEVVEKTTTVTAPGTTVTAPGVEKTITAPGATVTTTKTVTGTTTPTTMTIKDWLKEVSKSYKGATVKVIAESTPPSGWIQETLVPEFEELTGIKVEIERLGWDDVVKKEMLDGEQKQGTYDLYYIDELEVMALFFEKNFITDILDFANAHSKIYYPDFDLPDLIPVKYFTYNGKVAGIPFELFFRFYAYRTDLFNDPAEKSNFKAKYGIELKPPQTWAEYEKIAEFFTRPDKNLYGHIAIPSSMSLPSDVDNFLLTYGITNSGISVGRKASVENGGELNSPAALLWFKRYIDWMKFAPPGIQTFTWDNLASEFLAGHVVQGLVYGDQLAAVIDPSVSRVAGKIDVSLPPIEPKYMKSYCPSVFGDMGIFALSSQSKNKEAAFLFLQWIACKENAAREMEALGTLCTRASLLFSPLAEQVDAKYKWNYFKVLRQCYMQGLNSGPYAPMPELLTFRDILWKELTRAIAGEIKPEEALNNAARGIDEKSKELGW